MPATILRSLGLDLLAYQVQGRIRNTLVSTRAMINPANGVVSNVQKLMAVSEVYTFAPATMSAFVLRTSAPVSVLVTFARTPTNTTITMNCNGLLVLTDQIVSAVITNPSALATVDISIASI